ncbi:MAG: hypothetical protein JSU94_17965 [Phycisphaerales bacterium]|nr:MAG: hypothetical protein JSU94_17965 [Phycisphaerales bacterium]
MARNKRGKMALYEAMSKARQKPGFGRTLERMREDRPHDDEPDVQPEHLVVAEENVAEEVSEPKVRWTRKPSVAQLNAGRIEFSMPYQLAITMVLGFVLAVLLAFRAGQWYGEKQQGPAEAGANAGAGQARLSQKDYGSPGQTTTPKERATQDSGQRTAPVSTGDHVIVIVEYGRRDDLAPVQKHFAESNIETEIISQGGRYFLISKDRYDYDSLSTPGSDGYKALMRIRQVGPGYRGKAPDGMETFAPHFFTDAYGMKVN